MKMPEKHDLLAAILAAKEQGIGAILAFAMAYLLPGEYNGGAFYKNSNRRNDVRHYRLVHSYDLLDFAGQWQSYLAYITSVFIGYIGTDSIGSLIKRFAAKKAGNGKMVKSIINVRRSSICWRGRRELITDVRKPEIMVMTSL